MAKVKDNIYKNEKTGKYYVMFYCKDFDGNNKKVKKEGLKTIAEAKAWMDEYRSNQKNDSSMKFGTLCEQYLKSIKQKRKETTYNNKQNIIDNHILPTFKNLPINQIHTGMIEDWQAKYIANDSEYSPVYVRNINNILSAIFNYAIKHKKLLVNPVRELDNIGESSANRCVFWTQEDFNKFLETLKTPTQWNYMKHDLYYMLDVAFNVMFYTGLRIGELLALNVEDFDAEASTIDISKTYKRLHKKNLITLPKTKKSERIIVLPKKISAMLKEYISTLESPAPSDRLFSGTEEHNIRRIFYNVTKRAGLKKIRLHDLRHSHASLLIDMGFQPIVVAKRLGHASVRTTMNVYAHCYDQRLDEVANRLDNII